MKRHPALQDLSRDHFVALNAIVEVKRVHDGDPHAKDLDAVWLRFVELAHGTLSDHFEEEEELLLPLTEGRPEADRLQADHARLRAAFGSLTGSPDIQRLWNVAEDLRLHIRWEEEVLFEGMQTWLSEAELAALHEASDGFRRAQGMPVGPA